MSKKKLLPGLLILATASLASCGGNKVDPYAVEVNKPMILEDGDPNDATFSWAPVNGADGYLIKVDDEEQKGIGNPVFEQDGTNVCYYVLNTDSLAEGEHKIQFAAYSKDKVSEWTDVLTIKVEKEVVKKLSRPVLTNEHGLTVCADADADEVEFDFGDGIVAKALISTLNVYDEGNQIRFLGDPEVLGVADKLEFNKTYTVTVRVARKGEYSEKSNPLSYTFDNEFYNALSTPVIANGEVTFEEPVQNPNLTVKINSKEYTLNIAGYHTSLPWTELSNALLEKELVTYSDLYSSDSLEFAVKVNYDATHYKASEYSNTYTVTTVTVDEEEAEVALNSFQFFMASKNEIQAFIPKEDANFVTVSAKVDGEDVQLQSLETTVEVEHQYMPILGYVLNTKADAKQAVFTVTYTRGEFVQSKEYKFDLINLEEIKINNLMVNDSTLSWSFVGNGYALDNAYIVEIKSGENTLSFKTSTNSFDLKDVDVEGQISVKVYAMSDNAKLESSASDELSLRRESATSDSLVVEGGYYRVPKNHKLVCYKENEVEEKHALDYVNLSDYYKVELIRLGDGITSIDSKPTVYKWNIIPASNLVYTVEDARYIVLKDYKWSDLLNYSYSDYILTDAEGNEKFDMATYHQEHGDTLNVGKSRISLSASETNEFVSGQMSFTFAPNVTIKSDSSEATSSIKWDAIRTYYGNYEVLVEKYDEKLEEFVKDDTLSIASTENKTIDMSNAAVGRYRINIRALGNGNVLTGLYKTIEYYANENKIEIEDVKVVYGETHVTLKNDFNLGVRYALSSSNNSQDLSYSTMYDSYISLYPSDSSYANLIIKTESNANPGEPVFVRFTPSASFSISEIKTEYGSVFSVNNISPAIPYGMGGDSTIYSPYFDNRDKTWKYAKQAAAYVVDEKTKEDGQTEQVTKEFVVFNIDLGVYELKTSSYAGSPYYNATKVVLEKDKNLLEELQKAVILNVTDKELKALYWQISAGGVGGTPTAIPENTVVSETLNLELKKDTSCKTYAYSGALIDGTTTLADLELKVYADGRITIGGYTMSNAVIENNMLTYSPDSVAAYYSINETDKTYAPYLPEGTNTEYVVSEQCLTNLNTLKEMAPAGETAEIDLLIELVTDAKLYTYEDYLVVKVDGKHTATYDYDGSSNTVTYNGATFVLSPEDHTFSIQGL